MSVHCLYTGVSLCGKTTLARANARVLAGKGHRGAVYDSLGTGTLGGGWPEGWKVFDDPYEFMAYVESDECRGMHLFIDEAHEILGHQMPENFWILTKGRHFGLICHLMTQRPNKLHPDVRSQCGTCFMFRLAQDDAYEIGKDYGHSALHKISLDRGDFMVLKSGSSAISRANVFKLVN
jgi:hypothetical protein